MTCDADAGLENPLLVTHQDNHLDSDPQPIVSIDKTSASVNWDAGAGDFIAGASYDNLVIKQAALDKHGNYTALKIEEPVPAGKKPGFWLRLKLNKKGELAGRFFARQNDLGVKAKDAVTDSEVVICDVKNK